MTQAQRILLAVCAVAFARLGVARFKPESS